LPVSLVHFVMYRSIGTYSFLGIGPGIKQSKMGVNTVGLSLANAYTSAFIADGYKYSHHQALKNYILSECTDVSGVRRAIVDVTSGKADHWPTPVSLMSVFSDALGDMVLFEIGGDIYYEYDPTHPNRLEQFPLQFVVRDNDAHKQSDHRDANGGSRYNRALANMQACADQDGIGVSDIFQLVSRDGHPFFDYGPSNKNTIAVLVSHGVLTDEDPRITTMWVALGNPDYSCFVPCWTALEGDLSPRISTNEPNLSIGGLSEQLLAMRVDETYDEYINDLIVPMENNFVEAVQLARTRWLQNGFDPEEARRIHHQASETAFETMSTLTQGKGRQLNQTPLITAIEANPNGLIVSLHCVADDRDGSISSYDWDLGDGTLSTGEFVQHSYSTIGSYLVRCQVSDNQGSSNSKWTYIEPVESVNEPTDGGQTKEANHENDGGTRTEPVMGPDQEQNQCDCLDQGKPVCGKDGITYLSLCHLHCQGTSYLHDGHCQINGCGCAHRPEKALIIGILILFGFFRTLSGKQ